MGPKKILVTGIAGFIGYHLAKKLININFIVVGIDNLNNYYDTDLKIDRLEQLGINRKQIEYARVVQSDSYSDLTFIKLDLCDSENISLLFNNEKFDFVVNLAAQAGVRYSVENPKAYLRSNIDGFLNILESCKDTNVDHLVFASSSSVYGMNNKMPFSVQDSTDHPVSLYAATKKSNELMAHVYSHLFNLPVTGLRFFTVYGPWGRPDMALFLFANAILNHKPIRVFNNGDMARDFTYIDDVVEGIIKVLEVKPRTWSKTELAPDRSTSPYRLYNIGSNRPVKLLYYIDLLEKAFGCKTEKEFLPMQPGDVQETFADIKELIDDFTFSPQTSIKQGIAKYVKWYKSYYLHKNPVVGVSNSFS